jgi:putative ABC transport system permease protein
MNIAVVQGRNFDDSDRFSDEALSRDSAPKPIGSVIVNTAFASRYYPAMSPIGQQIVLDDDRAFGAMRTIVGVVADARQRSIAEPPRPTVFIPHGQHPDMIRPSLVVRTAMPDGAVGSTIRDRLRAFDPQLVVLSIRPMDDVIASALSRPRFNLLLMASFAGVALLLSGLGIYGVLAYVVAERTREIGIRMALGARAADVVRLMLREGLASVAAGAGIGVAAALALGRLLRALLFGVTPLDPLSVIGAPALLAAIAAIACYLPTRRATRVDPIVALRED